jgi:hypothetical protein
VPGWGAQTPQLDRHCVPPLVIRCFFRSCLIVLRACVLACSVHYHAAASRQPRMAAPPYILQCKGCSAV